MTVGFHAQHTEVREAGDRLLYAAHLYRQGKADRNVCTGDNGLGGNCSASYRGDMSEFPGEHSGCRERIS